MTTIRLLRSRKAVRPRDWLLAGHGETRPNAGVKPKIQLRSSIHSRLGAWQRRHPGQHTSANAVVQPTRAPLPYTDIPSPAVKSP